MKHWCIVVDCSSSSNTEDEIEELGLDLVSQGALGAHESEPQKLCFYLNTVSKPTMSDIQKQFSIQYPCTIEEVPDTNWIQQCAELLVTKTIDSLSVIPVATAEEVPESPEAHELYIIPGLGFGTGHHATTKNVLAALQLPIIRKTLAQSLSAKVLDVGTGSGILAIAAAKLFGAACVATDIDEAALDNARENASINHCGSIIHFSSLPLAQITGPFALVMANIYVEVLTTMEQHFHDLLMPGNCLILSGIMESKRQLLRNAFPAKRWKEYWSQEEDSWVTILFTRN